MTVAREFEADKRNARRLELYRQGLSDPRIAIAEGVTSIAILKWRRRNALPAQAQIAGDRNNRVRSGRGALAALARQERLRLYHLGHSDTVIARIEEVNQSCITRWRHANGLPAHNSAGGNYLDPGREKARLLLHRTGLSDTHIAAAEAVTAAAIQRWRRRRGLVANARPATSGPSFITGDPLLDRVRRAIGFGLSRDILNDAEGELCMAVLSGEVERADIEKLAPNFRARALRITCSYRTKSIETTLRGGDGLRLIETLADDRFSYWLEEMGASAW